MKPLILSGPPDYVEDADSIAVIAVGWLIVGPTLVLGCRNEARVP